MSGSLGGMGGNRDTGARLLVLLRVILGGEGADSRVERELEVTSSSVCRGGVTGFLMGVDGEIESGLLGGGGIIRSTSGDAALFLI